MFNSLEGDQTTDLNLTHDYFKINRWNACNGCCGRVTGMKFGFKVDLNSQSSLKACHSLSIWCHTWDNVCDTGFIFSWEQSSNTEILGIVPSDKWNSP